MASERQTQAGVALEVEDLRVRYGEVLAVDGVSFQVVRGEHLTLLGPSGCGKTTTLRAIAGLEPASDGEIRIEGRPVFSARRKIDVPAERRELSMVFQSYAIWPHMTVLQNVAYGLEVRRRPRAEVRERAQQALDLVQLGHLGQRSAARLSGGQQQRVALARSFAFDPKVLLLDEPLSNLDAKLRAQMRIELKELQRRLGITSIYVTHDQEEALAISDRVIVMNAGRVEQEGRPAEIYNFPRTRFVADFIGAANILAGRLRPDLAVDGLAALELKEGPLVYSSLPVASANGGAAVSVRTVYPELHALHPGAERNVWPGRVAQRIFLGDFVQYLVDWQGGRLTLRKPPVDDFAEGDEVFVRIDPRHCVFVE